MTFEEMFHRAAALQAQGKHKDALSAYLAIPKAMIVGNRAYAKAVYWNLGSCRLAVGDPLGAARAFKFSLDEDPDDENFWRNFVVATREACDAEDADFPSIVRSLVRVENMHAGLIEDTLFACLFDALEARGAPVFLNIGANDGVHYNPLQHRARVRGGWRGVMVEPNPAVFRRLAANYAGFDNVGLENICIGQADGKATFHIPAPPAAYDNPVLDQIGSLDRAHVVRHLSAFFPDLENPENWVQDIEVETLTVDSLLRRRGLERVDMLVTDAEGYDAVILGDIDLNRLSPAAVLFERKHMPAPDRERIDAKFADAGYDLLDLGEDGLAIRRGVVGADVFSLFARIAAVSRRQSARAASDKKALDALLWLLGETKKEAH